jgi:hypothetical protein
MTNRLRRGSILPGRDRDRDGKATAVGLVWCILWRGTEGVNKHEGGKLKTKR